VCVCVCPEQNDNMVVVGALSLPSLGRSVRLKSVIIMLWKEVGLDDGAVVHPQTRTIAKEKKKLEYNIFLHFLICKQIVLVFNIN
jgi:hypothetical protein